MTTRVQKVWGYEEHIVNTEHYCGKRMVINKGFQSSMHYHKIKDETLYVERGLVRFEFESNDGMIGSQHTFGPGMFVRLKPGERHRFAGLEDSVMFEFSTHDDPDDNYRLTQSGPIE